MAGTAIATTVTTDGATTGVSLTGPKQILVHGDTVYDGSQFQLEIADTDTSADYQAIHFGIGSLVYERFSEGSPQQLFVNAPSDSSYFIRINVENAATLTSITVVAN